MNFIQRVFEGIRNFWGNNFSFVVPSWAQNRPLPARLDYRRMIVESYESNPLAYAAILEIATSMAESPICVRDRDTKEPLPSYNPLVRLLETPNDYQSMPELVIETTAHLLCTGNCFWVMGEGPLPNYLQTLPPEHVRPIFDGNDLFYEFNNYSNPKVLYPADQIIHFRESPDLQDPVLMGMSPLLPIRQFIRIDNILSSYVSDFFYNNAVPPALLIFKNKLAASEVERLESKMKSEHAGPGNFHKLGVSFGDAKLEKLGLSVKDLDIKPVLDFVETRILMAFNVPAVLVGAQAAMGVSASYSNYKEARASFQTENLSPRQRIMERVLTRMLASKFSDQYEIYFDQSNVLALADQKEAQKKFALDSWNASAITLNEYRKIIGMTPLPGPEGEQRKSSPTGGTGVYSPAGDQKQLPPPIPPNGKDAAVYDPNATDATGVLPS